MYDSYRLIRIYQYQKKYPRLMNKIKTVNIKTIIFVEEGKKYNLITFEDNIVITSRLQ